MSIMNSMIDKTQLIEYYINQKLSSRKCAEIFGVSQRSVLDYLKKYSLPSRPVSENGKHFKTLVHTPEWNKKVSEALKIHNTMRGKFWERHHGYKDGIRSYQKYLSRGILSARCIQCDATDNDHKLVVHHIDGDRHNNLLDNLQVMCHSCHRKLHRRNTL